MKRFTAILALFVLALLLIGPSLAQDVNATETVTLPVLATTEAGAPVVGVLLQPSSGTPAASATDALTTQTTTIMNGMFFIVLVMVVGFLALLFIVLRQQSHNGNLEAQKVLALLESGRDAFFPRERVESQLKSWKEAAKQSPGFLDDMAVLMAEAGWKVIRPDDDTQAKVPTEKP